MKVAGLINGNLYRVRHTLRPVITTEHWDDQRKRIDPLRMVQFRGRQKTSSDNPAMMYLGVKFLASQLWGVRKFHWFLAEGQEVGIIGHEIRYIDPV